MAADVPFGSRPCENSREIPYGRAEEEFSRFFSLCKAIDLEVLGWPWPRQSFRTASVESARSAKESPRRVKESRGRRVPPLRLYRRRAQAAELSRFEQLGIAGVGAMKGIASGRRASDFGFAPHHLVHGETLSQNRPKILG
jgi:hypothetical protein